MNKDESLVKEKSNNIDEIKEYALAKESEISQYNTETLEKNKHKVIKLFKLVKNMNSIIGNVNVKEYLSNGKVQYGKDIEKIKLNSDKDGKLIKEKDTNGNLVPVSIPITVNGEEKAISVKDLIPNLKNLEGKEFDDEFSQLYDIYIPSPEDVYVQMSNDDNFDKSLKSLISEINDYDDIENIKDFNNFPENVQMQ
ncbi:hypothetical protein BCR36DRAFT_366619 [Piromyces finnis]|uniref:Uncharacterized protein n=1 Tax=Piromyces finnis TaxID=1754191 RepID=A0A1Y1VJX9_9FUNG|nr:hypothetical protein BCR36DRAFT_366619 [Piromyces finnis]|eukprot:ORX58404.1 hypothetical protein BCR36DRAFT_366619 [Piromyces finnis]